jgi:hypothetical protein
MKKDHIIKLLLIVFLVGDLFFSFLQYYNTPLYGDVDTCVLPDKHVQKVIDDPFGFRVICGEKHLNPNRFFSHFMMLKYMQKMPLLLQSFVEPITSVYLSVAILKIIVQIVFIFLVAWFVSGTGKVQNKSFLIAAAFITPLFQVYGYWSRMGIVDQSVTYTFFYALPMVLLMLFLFPIFNGYFRNLKFKKTNYLFLIPLTVILPLSGPLIPAVILLVSFFILVSELTEKKNGRLKFMYKQFFELPNWYYIVLIPASVMSLYSLVLGFYNTNYEGEALPLIKRFLLLPQGIISYLFHSLGVPLLMSAILVNAFLLRKVQTSESAKLLDLFRWIGIFCVAYTLLLPFGGYRPYRPLIIRYDTIIPMTVALIYIFTVSSFYLLSRTEGKSKKKFLSYIVVVLLIFTIVDFKGLGKNRCEKEAFQKMATSTEIVVQIPKDCFIMNWENISDYRRSENRAELIYRWNITPEKKLFYNLPD